MKKIFFLLLLIATTHQQSKACSCISLYFCNYVQDTVSKLAVKVRVIDQKIYNDNNLAVYLQVLTIYKDELQVTDTIKLYGGYNSSGCDINVLHHFPLGDTVIFALGYLNSLYIPIVNPDSVQESFSEFRPTSCSLVKLKLTQGVVQGQINQGLFAYPLDAFETGLSTCNFPPIAVSDHEVQPFAFKVFPNPPIDGKVYLESNLPLDIIDRIRVLSSDGRLIQEFTGLQGVHLEINGLRSGLYFLEIWYAGKLYYKTITAV